MRSPCASAVLLLASACVLAPVALAGCPFHTQRRVELDTFHAASGAAVHQPQPTSSWGGSLPASTDSSDPFVAMDLMFQSIYSDTGNAVRPEPIIVQEGDYLVLFRNDTRVEKPLLTMRYHNLKMVCHVVLGTYMTVLRDMLGHDINTTVALQENTLSKLAQFQSAVLTSRADLLAHPARFDAGDQLSRQLTMMNTTLAHMHELLTVGKTTMFDVNAFTSSLIDPINTNLDEAAADEVSTLFGVMEGWRKELTADEWASLKVVVTTSHMAHRANIVAQFMSRYFEVDIIQSDRFVTLESVSTEADSFRILDSHVTDYAIGDSFFNDHWRMHQDALCAGAKKALDRLFPASKDTAPGCFVDPPNPSV